MDLSVVVLPPELLACGWLAALPVLAAIALAPWRQLRRDAQAHVFCGGILALVLLWTMRASLGADLRVHLLGVAAYTLLLGPRLALAGAALALTAMIALQGGAWINAGAAYMAMVLLPVGVTAIVACGVQRWASVPALVRVVAAGWIAGAASLAISQGVCDAMLAAGARTSLAGSGLDFAALLACLASGEATLTGLVLTLFAVNHPHAVAALHDIEQRRARTAASMAHQVQPRSR